MKFDPPLDKGIKHEVEILIEGGIETFESCEGGRGHSYPEPTIRFHGNHTEGFKAFSVAVNHGLRVSNLRRMWSIQDNEPVGPYWEMTFVQSSEAYKAGWNSSQ